MENVFVVKYFTIFLTLQTINYNKVYMEIMESTDRQTGLNF